MEKKVVTSVCEWGFRRTGQMGSSMYYGEGEMMENGWTDELREQAEQIATLKDELAKLQEKYSDLIMQVSKKYPGETRHDTAKRYIILSEQGTIGGMGSGGCQTKTEILVIGALPTNQERD